MKTMSGKHGPAGSHKSSLQSTCREDERNTAEGRPIHLGLQPEETVSILEELARLAETRCWKNTLSELKSHRFVCTLENNEVSEKILFVIEPFNVTHLSLARTHQTGKAQY